MEEDFDIYMDLPNIHLAESDINVRFNYGNVMISTIHVTGKNFGLYKKYRLV